MIKVILYTREGCQLCDEAVEELQKLQDEIPHQLVEIDIESDSALLSRYVEQIPVIQVGPYTKRAPFTATDLRVTLSAARDGLSKQPEEAPRNRDWSRRINRVVLGLSRHWLAMVNIVVFIYIGLAFAAPILVRAGNERPASVIYAIYGRLCHQLAFRSWFLYGEQPAYPRELAGTELMSYGEATGHDESDHALAQSFIGDEALGYKVALCERDVGIYGSILVAGLIFALVRKRLKPLPIWAWLLFGIIPIALDGGSQLVFGMPLPLLSSLPIRESTPFLRTITGVLFGVANVWLSFPYVEESMAETRVLLTASFASDKAETVS
jgi:uncharacterized membrane protein